MKMKENDFKKLLTVLTISSNVVECTFTFIRVTDVLALSSITAGG